ncbi:MAG: hypothetical protein U0572_11315 [Phycisphaerales bacterium]
MPRVCLGCHRQLPGFFRWTQGRYGDAGFDCCEFCNGVIKINDNDGTGPTTIYYLYARAGQLKPDYRWQYHGESLRYDLCAGYFITSHALDAMSAYTGIDVVALGKSAPNQQLSLGAMIELCGARVVNGRSFPPSAPLIKRLPQVVAVWRDLVLSVLADQKPGAFSLGRESP